MRAIQIAYICLDSPILSLVKKYILSEVDVIFLFITDGGDWAVAGVDAGIIGQREQFLADSLDEHFFSASAQIGTADAETEQDVAREQDVFFPAIETKRA